MTNAEKALEKLDEVGSAGFFFEVGEDIIRRALKIAAAVDGDGLVIPITKDEASEYLDDASYVQGKRHGNNDLLERLRGIK